MKKKNIKGFTLIELLAVIVVLAIVTVIATQSILPFMANAGRDSFASEANTAISGAKQGVDLVKLGKITSNYTAFTTKSGYCFTIDNLKTLGLFQKEDTSYAGVVVAIQDTNSNKYTYHIYMKSDEFYIANAGGSIENSDVVTSQPSTFYANCTTAKTALDK